jgi:hypothetical protein
MDAGRAEDLVAVGAGVPLGEVAHGTTLWRVDRWDADQTHWAMRRTGGFQPEARDFAVLNVRPYSMTEHLGNAVLQAGWARVLANLTSVPASTAVFDGTHTRIGVGDGSTAVNAASNTDLSGASKWFQLVSGAPTIGGTIPKTCAWSATFGTSDGNFAWNEFGIDNGTASGNTVSAPLLNRAVVSQGVKVAGQTWSATATLSFT